MLTSIPGLKHITNFITPEQEQLLLKTVDEEPWLSDLSRRVQHYGYKYNYKERSISTSMAIGPLPLWSQLLAAQIRADNYIPHMPDQMIVNEYLPGQGIGAHIDCIPCFDDHIASVSLGSRTKMVFTNKERTKRIDLDLYPRDLLVFSGESRYEWLHAIARTTHDAGMPRGRRVSLTFRKVTLR